MQPQMTYMEVAMTAITAFGLWYVIGRSQISLKPRAMMMASGLRIVKHFLDLIECPSCAGFWIGIGSAFFGRDFFPGIPLHAPFAVHAVLWGLFICGTNTLLASFCGYTNGD